LLQNVIFHRNIERIFTIYKGKIFQQEFSILFPLIDFKTKIGFRDLIPEVQTLH